MKAKKKGRLRKEQIALIDSLFAGNMSEEQILSKHNVRRSLYRKWLANESFGEELKFRMESARRQSELIIARYAPFAAAKLVELMESEKEETARKACLDIISIPVQKPPIEKEPADNRQEPPNPAAIQPEVASRLLAALAGTRTPLKSKSKNS